MNNKRYVARSTAIAARVLGDETMIMSATNSTLFTLDEVATVIWESADGATPLEEIVANKICTQYDITPEVALKDAEGRRDFFDILEYARLRTFCIKLKTNGILIRKQEADRIKALGVESVQISIYSHVPEVHDAITKLPGSLKQSIEAIRRLRAHGIHVIMANVLMVQNVHDYAGVRALAAELGAQFIMDPTITPMMDGDRSILNLNVDEAALREVFQNESLVGGNIEEFCAPPLAPGEDDMDQLPCSAGHTACYVSSGNVRRMKFVDIWSDSPQLNEVRSIKLRDMPTCSKCTHGGTCTRCPGLAYLEGNMRGPSYQDCEKSYARTGIPSENLKARKASSQPYHSLRLVQIQGLQPAAHALPSRVTETSVVNA